MKFFKKVALVLAFGMCFCATGCLSLTIEGSGKCLTCIDDDCDHLCDECGELVTTCTDFDKNHYCDVCYVSTGQCIDSNRNHICDVCSSVVSDCTDTSADHHCDVCGTEMSYCKDDDDNNRCDVCGKQIVEGEKPATYSVRYYVDGVVVKTETVESGQKAPTYAQQDREFAHFIGWTTDAAHGNFYDFTREVSSNLNLYAYYQTDYEAITNELTLEYMDSIVTVHAYYKENRYSSVLYAATGSGVIYKYDASTTTYYLLTNNHVVYEYKNALSENRADKLTIHDYCETEYTGTLVYNSADYDLAIIKFQKSTKEGEKYDLGALEFADSNPVVGDEIICIGNPYGQKNAITYGQVLGYGSCNMKEDSSHVEFSCIKHSAWMATGSSGGLLMDLDFKIIGINFAVQAAQGIHTASWSVPVSKAKEFVEAYH